MTKKELQRKIQHLVGILAALPKEKKTEVLEKVGDLSSKQLQDLLVVLENAVQKQTELMKDGFLKNPMFASEFEIFQETQLQKLIKESINAKQRGLMKDYLNFKSQWQKNT